MNRFSPEHVKQVAKAYTKTEFFKWSNAFSEDMQEAMVDSHIMNQIRIADSVDSTRTFTATEIIQFRDNVRSAIKVI